MRYSDKGTGDGPSTASVECGSEYTMVGCSGWSKWNDLTGMFIDGDTCYAYSVRRDTGHYVYATAIWYVLSSSSVQERTRYSLLLFNQ